MSPVNTAENVENGPTAVLSQIYPVTLCNSDETAISALKAARKLLHQTDCDPRTENLFRGIDITLIGDAEMAGLRDLICGVLSIRDRRPWSSNGKRVAVNNMTTFLGKISSSTFLYFPAN